MDMQAYVHTYCFGPGTRVEDSEGINRALTGVLHNWNSKGGPQTLYFAISVENPADGKWVSQEEIHEAKNGWKLLEAK